jgi:hypothetical protein
MYKIINISILIFITTGQQNKFDAASPILRIGSAIFSKYHLAHFIFFLSLFRSLFVVIWKFFSKIVFFNTISKKHQFFYLFSPFW